MTCNKYILHDILCSWTVIFPVEIELSISSVMDDNCPLVFARFNKSLFKLINPLFLA